MLCKKIIILLVNIFIMTAVWAEQEDVFEVPNNPYLANSAWPVAHGNNYAQDSSGLMGPTANDQITIDFTNLYIHDETQRIAMDPISLIYSEDGKTLWGSSFTTIFRVDRSNNTFKIISYLNTGKWDARLNLRMHGAYSLLAKVNNQEQFMVAKRHSISAYAAGPDGISIHEVNNYFIKDIEKEDVIVGLNLTYDGWLIYITKKGRVGALSLDFSRVVSPLQLPGDSSLDISNSFAVDNKGGIYIVSNQYMQRVNWDSELKQLSLVWNTAYDTGGSIPEPGRLGTGSGSTPSLMGNPTDGLYVVITDGAKLMNINVFDTLTGKLIAKTPVNFGDSAVESSTSEQSVLINGWKALVVNNQYDLDRPILSGNAPLGIQQFEFDPKKQTLISTWYVNHISVPNGIPTMSKKTELMYAIAKKKIGKDNLLSGWGLVGIDWNTGKEVFFHEVGHGLRYNSAYAATEVGLDGEIVSGTALGIMRFRIEK